MRPTRPAPPAAPSLALRALALGALLLRATPGVPAPPDGTSEVVPAELSGRLLLVAPAVAPPLVQGSFDAGSSAVAAEVRATTAAPVEGSALVSVSAAPAALLPGAGGAPSDTGADYALAVPSYGSGFLVAAELRLGGGEDLYRLDAVATGCTTRCRLGRPVVDLGCEPACAACPAGCEPPAPLPGVDLTEEVAFLELRFAAACAGIALNPTAAEVGVWVDDGDGLLDPARDALKAGTGLTNPDTAPSGARVTPLLAVPAGRPLLVSGEAYFGLPRRRVLLVADPRGGGPLVLAPGERLVVTDPVPVSGATLPPGSVLPNPPPRECDPPPTGLLSGSFDLAEDVCGSIDELLAFSTGAAGGPAAGSFALVSPSSVPRAGLPAGPGRFVDRFEVRGLLPAGRARQQLPELEGDWYRTRPLAFELNRAQGQRSLHRGTAPGLDGATSLLASDPVLDLDADCGLDPADPLVAAVQAAADLVDDWNDPPLAGLETANRSAEHKSCPTEPARAGEAPVHPALGDGLRVLRDPPASETRIPAFMTELRAGLFKGVLRLVDGRVDARGDVGELGVEGALAAGGFGAGDDPAHVKAAGSRERFETSSGASADTLPLPLRLSSPGSGRYPLRLPPGTPDTEQGLRDFFGMPLLLDLPALPDAEVLALPFVVPPDLSVPENRDAFDRSESLYQFANLVALGANVPGPVSSRALSLRLLLADLGGALLDGRLEVVDVTKPATRGTALRGHELAGALPASFPGPDFPSIAFPLTLARDLADRRRDGSEVVLPAGTAIDTAVDGSEHLLDPAVSDGSFRFGDAWANDALDATVDTEPTPDPDPDDNDPVLDRTTARSPLLVKPDEPPATRSRLLDRALLEPEELSIENFALCLGTVRVVLRSARGSALADPVVRGRGFLNAALVPDADGDGAPGPLSSVRPDLGVDLNEDGVPDQYLVLLDGPDGGFRGVPTSADGFGRNGSVTLVLPAGDYRLEPGAVVRLGGDPATDTFTWLTPLELTVECGGEVVVNAGDPACPLTQGFWKRQCAGPHPSGEHANLPAYVPYVSQFATFAGVTTEAELCERLHPEPGSDKCEQAEAQLMAMLLNLASGRVPETATVSPRGSGADDARELAEDIDRLLSDPARTFEDCVLAQSLAAELNEGASLPGSDSCGGELPPPPVGNSLRLARRPGGLLRATWRNLSPARARRYELVHFPAQAGVRPSGRELDMLGDWTDAGTDGAAGVELPEPAAALWFARARGLSPVFEYPGSLGP